MLRLLLLYVLHIFCCVGVEAGGAIYMQSVVCAVSSSAAATRKIIRGMLIKADELLSGQLL